MSNELAKANDNAAMVRRTEELVNQYAEVLTDRSGPALARIKETILGLFHLNPSLADAAKADPASLCSAVVASLNLGLSFNQSLQQAYLVPRKGKVCFQLGYRGLMELARRSGAVVSMSAELVYPTDRFDVVMGTDRRLVHTPDIWGANRAYANALGAYATATMANGVVDFEVMPKTEIERRRAVSASQSGPWRDWPEEMARKTVLRMLLKRLPLSVEAATLMKRDYEDDDNREPVIEGVRPASTVQRVQHPRELPALGRVEDAEVDDGQVEDPIKQRLYQLAEAIDPEGSPWSEVAVLWYLASRPQAPAASPTLAACLDKLRVSDAAWVKTAQGMVPALQRRMGIVGGVDGARKWLRALPAGCVAEVKASAASDRHAQASTAGTPGALLGIALAVAEESAEAPESAT